MSSATRRFSGSITASETSWKAAPRYLVLAEGLEVTSPKQAVRASLRAGVMDEEQARMALQMVDDRNLTSHTYNEELAKLIFARLDDYARLIRDWLAAMERNAADAGAVH
jgi:nucleotidyltransferase substrate binding protein (TIGR01987 family)